MKRLGIFALCVLVSLGALDGALAKSKKKPKKKPATEQKVESKAEETDPKLADAQSTEEGPPEGVFSEDEIRNAAKPTRASDWPGYAQ